VCRQSPRAACVPRTSWRTDGVKPLRVPLRVFCRVRDEQQGAVVSSAREISRRSVLSNLKSFSVGVGALLFAGMVNSKGANAKVSNGKGKPKPTHGT